MSEDLGKNSKHQVKKMDLEKYVDFMGFKSVYPYIKHGDVLVISSQSETFLQL